VGKVNKFGKAPKFATNVVKEAAEENGVEEIKV